MKRETPGGDLAQESHERRLVGSKYEKSVGGFNFAANTAIVSRLSARRAANKRKSRAEPVARSGVCAQGSLENGDRACEIREKKGQRSRLASTRLDSSRVESLGPCHAGRESTRARDTRRTPSHKSRYLIDQRRWHLLRRRCNVITRRGRRRGETEGAKGWKTKFSAGGRASELKFAIGARVDFAIPHGGTKRDSHIRRFAYVTQSASFATIAVKKGG